MDYSPRLSRDSPACICIHAQYICRLPLQRFLYRCLHRISPWIQNTVVSITRAYILRGGEINEMRARAPAFAGVRKKGKNRGPSGKNVELAPRYCGEAVDSHEVDPRREFHVPHVSLVFSFAGGGLSRTFFPRPFFPSASLRPSPFFFLASYLIRGSLIRTRGREWAAKNRPVLFRGVESPISPVSLHPAAVPAPAPKARAFKRYNRVALWKLMHSIADLCTIRVEYIGTHSVYEINFVHAPLASRPCNYQ